MGFIDGLCSSSSSKEYMRYVAYINVASFVLTF
jgi:hypothetical protein